MICDLDVKKVGALLLFLLAFVFVGLIISVITIFLIISSYVIEDKKQEELGSAICSPIGEVQMDLWNDFWETDKANNLKGYGDLVLEHSKKMGIDPVLVSAVIMQESGQGKYTSKNNPGGIMDWEKGYSQKRYFETMEDGIKFTIENLADKILNEGLVTIEDLGDRYAPVGASNDPNGLNKNWVPGVKKFVEMLGGLTLNCEEVGGGLMIIDDKAWPVMNGNIITSKFGKRPKPCASCSSNHNGIDIVGHGNSNGLGIVAFSSGVVETVQSNCKVGDFRCGGGFGNFIRINHGNGVESIYAHLSHVNVKKGEKVKAGNLIGLMGNTGSSTGAHLHFEIRKNGKPIDPLTVLSKKEFDYIIK